MADVTKLTAFPNGVAQFVLFGQGASAGNVTVAGIEVGDRILRVESLAIGTTSAGAVADLTSEFTVTAANTINNTGLTSTANKFVVVTIARAKGT